MYPEFLGIVCLIGPWLSRARIIRLRSSEAEFMNEWPELNSICCASASALSMAAMPPGKRCSYFSYGER